MAHAGLEAAPIGASTRDDRPDAPDVVDLRPPSSVGDAPSTVAVVGLGYVGLPTALALADADVNVVGVDASPARLAAIGSGDVDLLPADHDRLARLRGALTLGADAALVRLADAVIVCVPTPVDEHLGPDLGPLTAACGAVVEHARPGQTLVLTSTTYVGCTRQLLAEPLRARGLVPGRDIGVAFSPERIDPANAAFGQDRVPRVVGGISPSCTDAAASVIGRVAPQVHRVGDPETAELTKLLENTFRAVNIALANEFADIAGSLGLDIAAVVGAAATKPYGFMPFHPGPGVGGHCIPCDPHYLLWQLRGDRVAPRVIAEAMHAIAQRPHKVVTRAIEELARSGRGLAGARTLLVGASYKPGVADVRESPAITILAELADRGADVEYWDPLVAELRLPDGRVLRSVEDPQRWDPELVIAHTLHPGTDLGWAAGRCLLDATFRLDPDLGAAVV